MRNYWINFDKSYFSFRNLCDLCVLCGELNCYLFANYFRSQVCRGACLLFIVLTALPVSAYYDQPDMNESDLFIRERRHERWGKGERTFALYDNEVAQIPASPDAPMISARSNRFVPADIIPVNLPLHIALRRPIQVDNTLANLLYANLKLKRLIEEYEALQKRAAALLSDLSAPVADADYLVKDVKKFDSLHQERQELTRNHLAVVRKFQFRSAAVSQLKNPTAARVETLSALATRLKTTGGGSPVGHHNPHLAVAKSHRAAVPNGDKGKRMNTGQSVDTSLPWLIEAALKTIKYFFSHKLEALIYGAILMVSIVMLSSIRRS